MRIACLGNMNNNFFALTRHLRDRGLDAELLLFDVELDHFRPDSDSYDREFERYTVQLDWGRLRDVLIAGGKVRRSLARHDVLIGCGFAPAFAARIGRRLDLFVPYGADLVAAAYQGRRHLKNLATFYQRRGIARSRALLMDNREYYDWLPRLGFSGQHLQLPIPFIYTPLYNPAAIAERRHRSRFHPRFMKIREASDLVVFHHSRHVWQSGAASYARKGNDRLIRGFAELAASHPGKRPHLVLFEYGPDVAASRQLIADLGIADRVTWFPTMARKEIMAGISLADVGAGEFDISWITGGVIFEFLAMARPLIHHRSARDDRPDLYPILAAHTAAEIAAQLDRVAREPEACRALGERGRIWLQQEAVDRPMAAIVDLLARR